MTDRELLELILKNQEAIRSDINKVEAKVDNAIADIKEVKVDLVEIKTDVQYLKNNDEIDSISINGAYNLIKGLDTKFDKLVAEINHQRRFMQKSIGDLSADYSNLEERVEKLEQDKKAS
jgi:chromosome segregation ATPase